MLPTLKERVSLLPEFTHPYVVRAAAEASEASYLDYSILGVAVVTLGLILFVQLLRHRLDRNAVGRPFVKTVLEGVYRELATLGIVEFVIFLLHKYYTDLNVAQELTFADVHFTLFFTSIFNAFQSCIMAFFISRNSHRLWVQTEYQDLHHYVEIREEFDRLDKELRHFRGLHGKSDDNPQSDSIKTSRGLRDGSNPARLQDSAESSKSLGEIQHLMQSIRRLWLYLLQSVRYPRLSRRHNDLLVQVRFHELKYHFILANKLPINMHLSVYMKRCELRILQKLVHIKTLAWLLLTGGFNLLYFLMGVVVYTTEGNLEAVGRTMTVLFLGSMFFSVLLSLIIWNKVTWIFDTIMRTKLITQTGPVEELENRNETNETPPQPDDTPPQPAFDQQSLFWGSNPRFIIVMIQIMQSGFALAMSILLVFWGDIDPEGGSPGVKAGYFLLVVVICFICFVLIISRVVPRFTLCSSVGQMVDHVQLHETLARHKLETAQRERRQKLMEKELEDTFLKEESENVRRSTIQSLLGFQQKLPLSGSKAMMDPTLWLELIRTSTQDLRSNLPEETDVAVNQTDRIQARRNRRKTLSDGVEAMRDMVGMRSDAIASSDHRKSRGHVRKKSLSASASIRMMRDVTSLSVSIKPKPLDVAVKTKDDIELANAARAKRRANRKKTASASADIRMMRMGSHREDSQSSLVPFSNPLSNTPIDAKSCADDHPFDPKRVTFAKRAPVGYEAIDPLGETPLRSICEVGQKLLPNAYHLELGHLAPSNGKHENASAIFPSSAQSDKVLPTWVDNWKSSTESLPAANSNGTIENMKMPCSADEVTVEAESDDDEHSDVDDLPEVQENDKLRKLDPAPPKRSLSETARAYFRSRRYILVSSLFGTMLCFFCVAMRLEAVLIDSGILIDYENTWHLDAKVSFWVEFVLLALFQLGDLSILYLFRPSNVIDDIDEIVFSAAILDLLICASCFSCLVAAEVLRCCDDVENRYLAGSVEQDDYYKYPEPIPCCPVFGSRLYGGFGNVEMFTSLIALRVFRFYATKVCVRGIVRRWRVSGTTGAISHGDTNMQNPLDPFYEVSAHMHGHTADSLQFLEETGTIVELWKSALALFPEVVATHGEFSSQLLQAMLGIPIETDGVGSAANLGGDSTTTGDAEIRLKLSADDMSLSKPASLRSRHGSGDTDQLRILKPPSLTTERRYVSLSSAAQAVIIAGKLGKAVRANCRGEDPVSFSHRPLENTASSNEGGINQTTSNVARHSDYKDRSTFNPVRSRRSELGMNVPALQIPEFEIIDDDEDESATQFFAPNARLIRSMRRCDRKVIPILHRWAAVDVVITTFEIVYFDASHVDVLDTAKNARYKRMDDIRQAIIATKGGKGLRLRDIAFGRRVVGTQVLNDIVSIHVDRILPPGIRENDCELAWDEPQADEFWKTKVGHTRMTEDTEVDIEKPSRHNRWTIVKEDRLRIKTEHDTLYLRFYSDLERCESHSDKVMINDEAAGDFLKNNAFQWCQTIGRLVGASNLKQELPNFGDESSDELRDYLVLIDPNNDNNALPGVDMFKKMVISHRRQRSDATGIVPPLFGSPRRHQSRFPVTTEENSSSSTRPLPKPLGVRRAISHHPTTTPSSELEARKFPIKRLHVRRSTSIDVPFNPIEFDLTSSNRTTRPMNSAGDGDPDSTLTSNVNTPS